jgi:hypothetical protein
VALALVAAAPWAAALAARVPACPVKTLSGWPCPACGTTRAAVALAGLDPGAALLLNPLATLGWIVLVGGGLVVAAVALAGRPLAEPRELPRAARWGIVAALALNWLYLVAMGR